MGQNKQQLEDAGPAVIQMAPTIKGTCAGDIKSKRPEEEEKEEEEKEDNQKSFPLVRIYILLTLTLVFGLAQLLLSHISHSLALRSDAYHTIYNLLTLAVGLTTFRLTERKGVGLRNTFGWTRAEVLGAAVTLVFLSALNFSVLVEALQTLVHAGHGEEAVDAMHWEGAVLGLGITGLLLNLLSLVLLGGYTSVQSAFLARVQVVPLEQQQQAQEAAPRNEMCQQGCQFMVRLLRDTAGCLLVMASSLVTMYSPGAAAIYFDPSAAILAVIIISATSIPYMQESSAILLQTLPASLDLETFQKQLRIKFPSLVDVHEIHLWQLTPRRIVATAHLVFPSTEVYLSSRNGLQNFFAEWGVTQVTLQPEFLQAEFLQNRAKPPGCYLRCQLESCRERRCCLSSCTEGDGQKDVTDDEEQAQKDPLLCLA